MCYLNSSKEKEKKKSLTDFCRRSGGRGMVCRYTAGGGRLAYLGGMGVVGLAELLHLSLRPRHLEGLKEKK
eukprot:COSAG05_NODE_1476_length_4780_cov_9.024989_4_plen_71_part_00